MNKQWDLLIDHLNRAVSPEHAAELTGVYSENLAKWTAYAESTLAVPIKPTSRKPSEHRLKEIRLRHQKIADPQGFTECETCGRVLNNNYIETHRRKKHD